METNLSSITNRLVKLRQRDRGHQLFGASSHRYYACPTLRSDELEEFERRAGLTLPSGYRDFLQTVAGGGVGPGYGLSWLTASLCEPTTNDEAWARAVAPRLFPTREGLEWFDDTLPPEPARSDKDWPEFLPPNLKPPKLSQRSERMRFILAVSKNTRDLLSAENVLQLSTPFAIEHGLDAEPEISSIAWDSLDSQQTIAELDRLWALKGFERAHHGTIPIASYGHGISALLVAHGTNAGDVWILDEENLLLQPFSQDWLDMHGVGATRDFRGPQFVDWYLDWLSCTELLASRDTQ